MATRWWLRLLQVVLLGLVLWFVYRGLAPDLGKLDLRDLSRFRPAVAPLALSLVLLLIMYGIHALVWRRITIALGNQPFALRPAMRVYFVSGLGRYIPGKLWQIAGMAVLAQRAGISAVAATAASLLGQLGFMTMGMIFLAILLPSQYGDNAAIAAAAMIAMAVAIFIVGGTERGRRLRHRVLERLGPRIAEGATLLDRLTVRRAAVWWAAYGLSWIVMGAAFTIFAGAFVPGALQNPLQLAGTVAASYLVGFLSPTPAGVGARELVMLPLLSVVMPIQAALVVSILSRVWFTAAELLPLLLIPLLPQPLPLQQGSSA